MQESLFVQSPGTLVIFSLWKLSGIIFRCFWWKNLRPFSRISFSANSIYGGEWSPGACWTQQTQSRVIDAPWPHLVVDAVRLAKNKSLFCLLALHPKEVHSRELFLRVHELDSGLLISALCQSRFRATLWTLIKGLWTIEWAWKVFPSSFARPPKPFGGWTPLSEFCEVGTLQSRCQCWHLFLESIVLSGMSSSDSFWPNSPAWFFFARANCSRLFQTIPDSNDWPWQMGLLPSPTR